MPISIHDARRLSNLRRDQPQSLFRQAAANVHFNVQSVVCAEFGDDSARKDIQVLETLENPSDCGWIRVRDDSKPP